MLELLAAPGSSAAGLRALDRVDRCVITVVLILCVAYLTLWERKVIGWMQLRLGPNRVRIFGLLPGSASRSPTSSSC